MPDAAHGFTWVRSASTRGRLPLRNGPQNDLHPSPRTPRTRGFCPGALVSSHVLNSHELADDTFVYREDGRAWEVGGNLALVHCLAVVPPVRRDTS